MPETLTLTLVGFGAVNRALARLIARDEASLAEKGLVVEYHAVIARHGCWEATGAQGMSAADIGALADAVAAGSSRLDGTTAPPADVAAKTTPSIEDIR